MLQSLLFRRSITFYFVGLLACRSLWSKIEDYHPSGASGDTNSPASNKEIDPLELFLKKVLKIEDTEEFFLNKEIVHNVPQERWVEHLMATFAPESKEVLGEVFRGFGRSNYNNVMLLGPGGVGKTFLVNQLIALLSFGIYPDYLKDEIGIYGEDASEFKLLRDKLIRNTDVLWVNEDLLIKDPTDAGKAFAKSESRMRTVLSGLFRAAHQKYLKTGRYTVFLFEEIATLPDLVGKVLKASLDKGGFEKGGFMALGITTPNEYRKMVAGDSATDRRWKKVKIHEMSTLKAFQVVRKSADVWEHKHSRMISDEAIWLLIHMRNLLNDPPLAMPASILAATEDLMLSPKVSGSTNGVIEVKEAERFIMNRAGLSDLWFEGPNGEPPLFGLAERVKEKVVGQDEIIDQISDVFMSWASTGFGSEIPVILLEGPPGAGKDTLMAAFSEVLFGHNSQHLMFSIGANTGRGIAEIFEGTGRTSDTGGGGSLLVEALDRGPNTGFVILNEVKDATSASIEQLKVLIESGKIRPRGVDTRERHLRFPIFLAGQYGEELFTGKSDEEIDAIYSGLSQKDLEDFAFQGQNDGHRGTISLAMMGRIKRFGGIFMLKPVPKRLYPDIVKLEFEKRVKSEFKIKNNIDLALSDELRNYIAEVTAQLDEGTRGLTAIMTALTRSAIVKARVMGLSGRSKEIFLNFDRDKAGKPFVIVKGSDRENKPQEYKIEVLSLLRIKNCALHLDQTAPASID